ncbi:MAG: AAA family ATPase, partial [Candidatus Dormiibacterota bacterium]
MLRSLVVQDLALLERAELELGAGLTLLTGETGSGKSLLVDALGLALGGRAQSGLVRAGAERAQVQASFESNGRPLEVQRTVGPRGSASRDGEPIAIADLAALGRSLVAVHGQHDQQALVEPGAQAALLDALAGAGAERARVAALHE